MEELAECSGPLCSSGVAGQPPCSSLASAGPWDGPELSALGETETVRREPSFFRPRSPGCGRAFLLASPHLLSLPSRVAASYCPPWDPLAKSRPCPPTPAPALPLPWAALPTNRMPNLYIQCRSSFSDFIFNCLFYCWLNIFTHIPDGFFKFNMSKTGIFICLWKISSSSYFLSLAEGCCDLPSHPSHKFGWLFFFFTSLNSSRTDWYSSYWLYTVI